MARCGRASAVPRAEPSVEAGGVSGGVFAGLRWLCGRHGRCCVRWSPACSGGSQGREWRRESGLGRAPRRAFHAVCLSCDPESVRPSQRCREPRAVHIPLGRPASRRQSAAGTNEGATPPANLRNSYCDCVWARRYWPMSVCVPLHQIFRLLFQLSVNVTNSQSELL